MIWFSIGDIYFTRRYLFQKMTFKLFIWASPIFIKQHFLNEENFAELIIFRTLWEFLPSMNECFQMCPGDLQQMSWWLP